MDINKLKTIFARAVSLPSPAEREAFLKKSCGEDTALRQQVEEMLRAQSALGNFLEPTVETQLPRTGADLVGKEVGPYKILQVIGEGGFGVVYMAEQEAPVRRKVELKMIKAGMDTKLDREVPKGSLANSK